MILEIVSPEATLFKGEGNNTAAKCDCLSTRIYVQTGLKVFCLFFSSVQALFTIYCEDNCFLLFYFLLLVISKYAFSHGNGCVGRCFAQI